LSQLSFGIGQSELVVMQCYKNKSSHFFNEIQTFSRR